ncbi:hypothetical protein NOS12_007340, partial [Streptomyces murinus]
MITALYMQLTHAESGLAGVVFLTGKLVLTTGFVRSEIFEPIARCQWVVGLLWCAVCGFLELFHGEVFFGGAAGGALPGGG